MVVNKVHMASELDMHTLMFKPRNYLSPFRYIKIRRFALNPKTLPIKLSTMIFRQKKSGYSNYFTRRLFIVQKFRHITLFFYKVRIFTIFLIYPQSIFCVKNTHRKEIKGFIRKLLFL